MPIRIQRKRTKERVASKKDPRPNSDRLCYFCGAKRAQRGQNGYCSAECRFWDKIEEQANGCWLWLGAKHSSKGYGRIDVNGKRYMAHTFAYELLVGSIPEGLQPDHLCRNTQCANPAHLEWVTLTENVKRSTVGSHQAKKTHCPKGHPYAGDNLIIRNGRRHCRACNIAHQKQYREARRIDAYKNSAT